MNNTHRHDYIPGTERYTQPDEIKALGKFLRKVREIQDEHTVLEEDNMAVPGDEESAVDGSSPKFPQSLTSLPGLSIPVEGGEEKEVSLVGESDKIKVSDINSLGDSSLSLEDGRKIELETDSISLEASTQDTLEDKLLTISTGKDLALEKEVEKLGGNSEIRKLDGTKLKISKGKGVALESESEKISGVKHPSSLERESVNLDLDRENEVSLNTTVEKTKLPRKDSIENLPSSSKTLGDGRRIDSLEDTKENLSDTSKVRSLPEEITPLDGNKNLKKLPDQTDNLIGELKIEKLEGETVKVRDTLGNSIKLSDSPEILRGEVEVETLEDRIRELDGGRSLESLEDTPPETLEEKRIFSLPSESIQVSLSSQGIHDLEGKVDKISPDSSPNHLETVKEELRDRREGLSLDTSKESLKRGNKEITLSDDKVSINSSAQITALPEGVSKLESQRNLDLETSKVTIDPSSSKDLSLEDSREGLGGEIKDTGLSEGKASLHIPPENEINTLSGESEKLQGEGLGVSLSNTKETIPDDRELSLEEQISSLYDGGIDINLEENIEYLGRVEEVEKLGKYVEPLKKGKNIPLGRYREKLVDNKEVKSLPDSYISPEETPSGISELPGESESLRATDKVESLEDRSHKIEDGKQPDSLSDTILGITDDTRDGITLVDSSETLDEGNSGEITLEDWVDSISDPRDFILPSTPKTIKDDREDPELVDDSRHISDPRDFILPDTTKPLSDDREDPELEESFETLSDTRENPTLPNVLKILSDNREDPKLEDTVIETQKSKEGEGFEYWSDIDIKNGDEWNLRWRKLERRPPDNTSDTEPPRPGEASVKELGKTNIKRPSDNTSDTETPPRPGEASVETLSDSKEEMLSYQLPDLSFGSFFTGDALSLNTYLRAAAEYTVGQIPLKGSSKQVLIDETLRLLTYGRYYLEKVSRANRDRLPGEDFGILSDTIRGTDIKEVSEKVLNTFGDALVKGADLSEPINRPNPKKGQTEWKAPGQGFLDNDSPKTNDNFWTRWGEGLIGKDNAQSKYVRNFRDHYVNAANKVDYGNNKSFGIGVTLEELISKGNDIISLESLRDSFKNSRYITTPEKFTSTSNGSNYMTLDSNHIWEIVFRPFVGKENGYSSWLPSFLEIDDQNKKAFNYTTHYSRGWLPITSYELQEKKLTSRDLPLYDGSLSYPVSMEFTNELRLTFVDDSFKSLRRYFDLCARVSAYMSNIHRGDIKKEMVVKNLPDKLNFDTFDPLTLKWRPSTSGISWKTPSFPKMDVRYEFVSLGKNSFYDVPIDMEPKILNPTVYLEGKIHPGLYKNLTFLVSVYIMTPQYGTIRKCDLLCVMKDYTIEAQGEIDSSPTELNITFSIVGENPILGSNEGLGAKKEYTPPSIKKEDTHSSYGDNILSNLGNLMSVF